MAYGPIQRRANINAAKAQIGLFAGPLQVFQLSIGNYPTSQQGLESLRTSPGDLANPHWRLIKLTDVSAEFQNLKYSDLRHKIDAVDLQGSGGGRTQAPSNEF